MKAYSVLICLVLASACATKAYTVYPLPGEPGHYVLVEGNTKKRGLTKKDDKVYDCYTRLQADGNWFPECREVKKP